MTTKILSIEIENTYTKVCEIDYKSKKPRIYHCFDFKTPKDLIDDGYVKASEHFSEELLKKCKEYKINTKKVVFTISSTKIAIREVTIPFVNKKKIKDIILANATEYFPVDISNYHLTYSIVDILEGEANKKYKLSVIAVPKDLILSYFELAKKCSLDILAIDYSGNSIYQVVKNQFTSDINLIIKVDEMSTLLTVIKDKTIVLQRTVNYGANNAIDALIHTNAFGETITIEEALKIFRTKACINNRLEDYYYPIDAEIAVTTEEKMDEVALQAKAKITESLRYLVNSILRVIDYYNSRNKGNTINSMVLTGLAGDFNGLSTLLSYEFGNEVKVLNEIEDIKLDIGNNEKVSFGEYITCFGAAIKPVDFVSYILNEKKLFKSLSKENANSNFGIFILVGGILISITLSSISFISYKQALDYKNALEIKAANYKEAQETYKEYNSVKEIYDNVMLTDTLTASSNENLVKFIEELEEKMPSSIRILSLTASNESINLNITVDSKEASAEVIRQLRTFENISSITTAGITQQKDENGNSSVNFSVECFYNRNTTNNGK